MDKSSSLAPFAFILHRSSPGSEHSCFRPARKLHLKLALWSEWLISHLAGMKANESSKETASPLLYIQPRHASPIYENLSSACSRWLPEVSESCIIVWSGGKKKIQNGSWCPFSLTTSECTNKSQTIPSGLQGSLLLSASLL